MFYVICSIVVSMSISDSFAHLVNCVSTFHVLSDFVNLFISLFFHLDLVCDWFNLNLFEFFVSVGHVEVPSIRVTLSPIYSIE